MYLFGYNRKKPNKYMLKFKCEAVCMMIEDGLGVPEVSRKLGVSENQLCTWRKMFYVSVFEYGEAFWHRNRRHSTLGGVCPIRLRAVASPR